MTEGAGAARSTAIAPAFARWAAAVSLAAAWPGLAGSARGAGPEATEASTGGETERVVDGPADGLVEGPSAPPMGASTLAARAAEDVVLLVNGGLVRGTLLEVEPGVAVVIVAALDGTTRRFGWGEVLSVERGVTRSVRDGSDEGDESEASASRPRVHVAVADASAVELQEVVDDGILDALVPRCAAPCDRPIRVDRGRRFVITGEGVTTSRPFGLDVGTRAVVAEVRPGRSRVQLRGLVAIGVAAGLAGSGATLLGVRHAAGFDEGVAVGSGTAMLVGGVALLAGGVAMVIRGRTQVRVVAYPGCPAGQGSPRCEAARPGE